jgi:hypothetical protein
MFSKGLSLDQSPPFSASLRFFLTAPLFLIIAAVLFFLKDIDMLDRWLPATIGIIHFYNLGFLVMVMMGVLTQMLPVLAGVTIPNVLWVSRIVHLLLTLGAVLFPLGMLQMNYTLIQVGAVLAWSAICIFYSIVLNALFQDGLPSFTLTSFKLSSLSALVTLLFAGRLAWGWAAFGEFSIYRTALVELHIAWAIFGIVFTLIMGVSYKVVPMFFVTTDHPRWLTHYGSKIIFSLLVLWSAFFHYENSIVFFKAGISLVVLAYSIETIRRLNKRKRPLTDTSILYWYLSMVLFSISAIFYNLPALQLYAALGFALAILSLITGMLYKIIPFLAWLHLTKKNIPSVPTMRELLPDRYARKQLYLHLCMIVSLVLVTFFPAIKLLSSFFLIASVGMMIWVILRPLKKLLPKNSCK